MDMKGNAYRRTQAWRFYKANRDSCEYFVVKTLLVEAFVPSAQLLGFRRLAGQGPAEGWVPLKQRKEVGKSNHFTCWQAWDGQKGMTG